ncbi:AAA family ATPase [Amycolatopsis japonica]|uniref:AAA family ATPase n=1 Tax=Amycolatopsis japonica TaxID=208439 RepID=UPI0033272143
MTSRETLIHDLGPVRFKSLTMSNFLSYRSATLDFSDLTALIGPNGSGKSNAISAMKLLRDIALHGLPVALSRRGGYDQLRHRSTGRPYEPGLRIEFTVAGGHPCFYELRLSSLKGKRYEVKEERGSVLVGSRELKFQHAKGVFSAEEVSTLPEPIERMDRTIHIPQGQSILSLQPSFGVSIVSAVLQSMQVLEINPTRAAELQDPSPVSEFEPDGSNIASIVENFDQHERAQLAQLLAAVVPGIARIEVRHLADKVTVVFVQNTGKANREFFAKQMSDGTLRVFGILVAILQSPRPTILLIEEPEVAIHLGALQTLVEILRGEVDDIQIVITTHSADIVDSVDLDDLRVVWVTDGVSQISKVAEHARGPIIDGLITPGALLRADALDPSL